MSTERRTDSGRLRCLLAAAATAVALVTGLTSPPRAAAAQQHRSFATPEEAVRVLAETVKSGDLDELLALLGPDARDLVSGTDAATGRQHRETFVVAMAEGWRLVDRAGGGKELVVGNEQWPFPIPLVRDQGGWKFDTAAGREEVIARRIGRNELAVIRICRTYVAAQRAYAASGHDGKPAGLYARKFASDPGTENGLYWPSKRGERPSPLGDLVAQAAAEGRQLGSVATGPVPFHGYYFRILEAQGDRAPGGAASYIVNGDLSGGFALIAWPATYDDTGVMTFIVNQEGIVYEKDLGPGTAAEAARITRYDPDSTWGRAQDDPTEP